MLDKDDSRVSNFGFNTRSYHLYLFFAFAAWTGALSNEHVKFGGQLIICWISLKTCIIFTILRIFLQLNKKEQSEIVEEREHKTTNG